MLANWVIHGDHYCENFLREKRSCLDWTLSGWTDQIVIKLTDQTHAFISYQVEDALITTLPWSTCTCIPLSQWLFDWSLLRRDGSAKNNVIWTRDTLQKMALGNRKPPLACHKWMCIFMKKCLTPHKCFCFDIGEAQQCP